MRKRANVTTVILLITLIFAVLPATALANGPSPWAADQVNAAINAGLVPISLQSNYNQSTTRAEFAALAVALYETATGSEITERMSFNDTDDVNVQKIGGLGVVTGVGSGNFDPNGTLTREQAAVMLDRLAGLFEINAHNIFPRFDDNQEISDWAVSAVGHMQAREIMSGVGDNMFSPRGAYTREQSIITILRLFELVQESSGTGTGVHINIVANANISIQSVTPSGITLVISNPEDRTFIYGSAYSLYVSNNGEWEPVAPIIDNYAFTSIGYDLLPGTTTEPMYFNWEWLFGQLPPGFYRFEKEIIYLRAPGDFDSYTLMAYFELS